jgi:hypothetical protein
MPVVQQIVPTRGREFWDSLNPKQHEASVGGSKGRGKGRKKLRLTVQSPNSHLKQLTDQSQHTSFTVVRVNRAISLSRTAGSGSACHVSTIARYSGMDQGSEFECEHQSFLSFCLLLHVVPPASETTAVCAIGLVASNALLFTTATDPPHLCKSCTDDVQT